MKENTTYILNWLARRVQFPGILPQVGLGFRSVEGTGKDSFFSFVGNKILGSRYFTQAPELSAIFADLHTTATKDKLLVVISECTRNDTNSCRQKVKSFMTSPIVKFRPLYVDEMIRANYAGVVMFGQDQQFLNLDGDDRRFVVMECLPIYANDGDYFSEFIPQLERPEVARAFYQFLMNRDVSQFKPSVHRPMTSARKNMVDFSARPFYVFLKEYIPSMDVDVNPNGAVVQQKTFTVLRSTLYERYVDFVQLHYTRYADDYSQKRKFMSELRTLVNDSMIKSEDGSIEYPFKLVMVRGYHNVKVEIECMMKFLNKYVPDEEKTIQVDEEDIIIG